ncbi:2-amino-4-hydroxy-6-hydroxymethyldihydropteridine diphosphokinase [Paenibacillus tepidiphilus]|uniref:2-amino-4-hydroxy-6- hydroxymethyldihydropteridine diphosphokinase n=1 Tax=Paenibacillus tepidiphilus TaxID=2608683 RepID=UPI00123A66C2|nr:2-amino-4-hydroxy-6-hydroxymethyldihydropteridine diphosphokinase [Paenibacillus tepidiphilus]
MNRHSTSDAASEAYIALGANLGNREGALREALHRLEQQEGIQVLRCSRIYETEPVGYLDQPQFLNMAAALSTTLAPEVLLQVMLEIEAQLGRVRDIRYGPRTVDLDLLWFEGYSSDSQELTLPHPRMRERAFVLVPLQEVVSSKPGISGFREWMQTAVDDVDGKEGIRLWTPNA